MADFKPLKYAKALMGMSPSEGGLNYADYPHPYRNPDANGGGLRAWQINQPFQNMNADINLPDDFSEMLANSPSIQKLGYSDPRITH